MIPELNDKPILLKCQRNMAQWVFILVRPEIEVQLFLLYLFQVLLIDGVVVHPLVRDF